MRSALIFPYFDLTGTLVDHVRLKIFPPRKTERGTVKYLQPRGTRPRLYVVRSVLDRVLLPDEPLLICEGEKKTLRAGGFRLAAVGLAGVEGWHVRGSSALLPEFDAIPLDGRAVAIIPDGDYETNGNVERAVRRFADALRCRGANPRRVRLPAPGAPA